METATNVDSVTFRARQFAMPSLHTFKMQNYNILIVECVHLILFVESLDFLFLLSVMSLEYSFELWRFE